MTATAPTRNELERLIEQATHKEPNRLQEAARAYLEARIANAGWELTPEVLREADWLYDAPGTAYTIADALGLSLSELRKALGRTRHVTCEECGRGFAVFEPRRKGGYSRSKETRCEECRRRYWQEQQIEWEAEAARQQYEHLREVEVDAQIVVELAAGRDPLALEALRKHLISFALYWIIGRPMQYTASLGCPLGPGCMICGREPVHLLVITCEQANAIPRDSTLWKTLRYYTDYTRSDRHNSVPEEQPAWPPLVSLHQALWRMRPHRYFSSVPFFPLRWMPVLLTCADCRRVVAGTHVEIELGDVRVQRIDGGITAEAANVRFEMKWQDAWL